jgi:hypothetical protein
MGLGEAGLFGPFKRVLVTADLASNSRDLVSKFGVDFYGNTVIFPTIDAAVGSLMASKGDTILVAPGHTEDVTATSIALDVAGITIEGMGEGGLRPILTFGAAAATITTSVANVTVKNIIHKANFADVAAAYTLTTAKDFNLVDCEFRDNANNLNFVNVVKTGTTSNAADGIGLIRCKRIGLGATTNTTIVNMLGTNDRLTIKDGYFAHAAITLGGLMIIAAGKVVTNAEITGNKINLTSATDATGGIIITTNGSTNSGYIDNNRIWSLDTTTPILVTASSGFVFGVNYYSGDADKSGYVLPAVDS